MSHEFVRKLMDNFSLEDFSIIKLMEEISEIEQEINLKKKARENRLTLLKRLLQKHENEDIKKAIQSFLMKIEGEHHGYLEMDPDHDHNRVQEHNEENKDEEEHKD